MSERFLKYAYELGASLAEKNAKDEFSIGSVLSNAVDRFPGAMSDAYDSAVEGTSRYFQDLDKGSVGLADGLRDFFKGPAISRGNRGFADYQTRSQGNLLEAARRQARNLRPGDFGDIAEYNRIVGQLVDRPRRGVPALTTSRIDDLAFPATLNQVERQRLRGMTPSSL